MTAKKLFPPKQAARKNFYENSNLLTLKIRVQIVFYSRKSSSFVVVVVVVVVRIRRLLGSHNHSMVILSFINPSRQLLSHRCSCYNLRLRHRAHYSRDHRTVNHLHSLHAFTMLQSELVAVAQDIHMLTTFASAQRFTNLNDSPFLSSTADANLLTINQVRLPPIPSYTTDWIYASID